MKMTPTTTTTVLMSLMIPITRILMMLNAPSLPTMREIRMMFQMVNNLIQEKASYQLTTATFPTKTAIEGDDVPEGLNYSFV